MDFGRQQEATVDSSPWVLLHCVIFIIDVFKTLLEFLCKLTKRFWVYKETLASYNKLFIVKNHFVGRCCIFSSDNLCILRMDTLLNKQKLKSKYNF